MDWDKIKGFRRSRDIDYLQQKMLDSDDDSREVTRDYQFVKDRVHKALYMSDDKRAHEIARKISECKKTRSERSRKIRTKKVWYYEGDGSGWTSRRISKEEQDKLLDDDKKYRETKGVCQSIWCNSCRKMAAKTFQSRIQKRLDRGLIDPTIITRDEWDPISKDKATRRPYRNSDLLHITGVVGLSDFNEEKINKVLKEDTVRWRRIRYTLRKTPNYQERWIEVGYEFEVVNFRHLMADQSDGSEYKKKQLRQLREHYNVDENVFVFIHWHGVTNLTKRQIDVVFGKQYFIGKNRLKKTNKETGLYVQKLLENNSLDKNIQKISSYNFKNTIRFKHNFRGKNYSSGEYLSDDELGRLITLYDTVQKRNWKGLFRSCENDWSRQSYEAEMFYEDFRYYIRGSVVNLQRHVMVVDPYGNVRLDCWDIDQFIQNNNDVYLTWITNQKIYEKVKVGRDYFLHPYYPWLEIYKNKWDFVDTGKNYVFDSMKDFFKKWKKWKTTHNSGLKLDFKTKEGEYARWYYGWEYSIEDENLPKVLKNLKKYEQLDKFERFRIDEKTKRGHTNLSNKGRSRRETDIENEDITETRQWMEDVASVSGSSLSTFFEGVKTNPIIDMNKVVFPVYVFLMYEIFRNNLYDERLLYNVFNIKFTKLISQNQKPNTSNI